MLNDFGLVETNATSVNVGDRFGRLVVQATGQVPNTYRYYAICQCSCGSALKAIRFDSLLMGATEACGCLQRERTTTHGKSSSVHYKRWRHMLDRCLNPECQAYPDYGGRGISVCDRWLEISSYLEDLPSGYFDGAELDRIDNDGDYEPGNVRWVSRAENTDNRRAGRPITFNGKTQSLSRWSEEIGIHVASLWDRLEVFGWTVERALTTPAIGVAERMAIARHARWGSHVKKPKPPAREKKLYEYQGALYTLPQLAEMSGVALKLLRKRICERHWDIDRAVSTKP